MLAVNAMSRSALGSFAATPRGWLRATAAQHAEAAYDAAYDAGIAALIAARDDGADDNEALDVGIEAFAEEMSDRGTRPPPGQVETFARDAAHYRRGRR